MDEGLPIAYPLLEKDVPVYAADGVEVGKVDHVVAAPELDIFHGIVIRIEKGHRFVPADTVASLHERGVDLSIDAPAVTALPEPRRRLDRLARAGAGSRADRLEALRRPDRRTCRSRRVGREAVTGSVAA